MMNKALKFLTRQPLPATKDHLLTHFVWTLVIAIVFVIAFGLVALPPLIVVG